MEMLDNTFYVIEEFFDEVYEKYLDDTWQYTTPFYYTKSSLTLPEHGVMDNNTLDISQWSHKLMVRGEPHPTVVPPAFFETVKEKFESVTGFKIKEIARSHVTMTTPVRDGFRAERFHMPAHVDLEKVPDMDLKIITCIYYVNDSDGDTILFETPDKSKWDNRSMLKETDRVTPKRGRFAFFKGDTWHAGSPPIYTKSRCVININLIIE
jgi:hypothetical protein